MGTFGPGDISANDYAFSGANSFWTVWSNTTFSSGVAFRPITIATRWGADSGTTTGHNSFWNSSTNRIMTVADFNVGVGGGFGAYNSFGVLSNTWAGNDTYYGGFSRTQSQNSRAPFKDGTGGGYSGKSGGDANIAGGTNNFAGVASPGGLGWAVTYQKLEIYVRRSGVWKQVNGFTRRSGVWFSPGDVIYVRRSGVWTPVAFGDNCIMSEYHVPEKGLEIRIDIDGEIETGWIVEGDKGWFGSIDIDNVDVYTGRHSSEDSNETIEKRLVLYYLRENALKWENYKEAEKLSNQLWPNDYEKVNKVLVFS